MKDKKVGIHPLTVSLDKGITDLINKHIHDAKKADANPAIVMAGICSCLMNWYAHEVAIMSFLSKDNLMEKSLGLLQTIFNEKMKELQGQGSEVKLEQTGSGTVH